LGYDANYAAASKAPASLDQLFISADHSSVPAHADKLREEMLRWQREATSRQQEVMELRSKLHQKESESH
jgi:glutamine synthetase adenylyltransferase